MPPAVSIITAIMRLWIIGSEGVSQTGSLVRGLGLVLGMVAVS
jgi:hypothetical protein